MRSVVEGKKRSNNSNDHLLKEDDISSTEMRFLARFNYSLFFSIECSVPH